MAGFFFWTKDIGIIYEPSIKPLKTLLLCNYRRNRRPSEMKIIYLLNRSSSLLAALSEAGFTLVFYHYFAS